MVRLGLFVSILALSLTIQAAYGQVDDGWDSSDPTDYGAGYKIIMFSSQGTSYPLIDSPLTSGARTYNAQVQRMWGTSDNTTGSGSLDCEPIGLPLPVDSKYPDNLKMLPGVISMACLSYVNVPGAAHGFGASSGFNWQINQSHEVHAGDVFDVKTHWLNALTIMANADRDALGTNSSVLSPLDFSNTSHWVIAAQGFGLTYSAADFTGFTDGGSGVIAFIPWSKLKPYLNPHGIVPRADWNANPPPGN